MQKILHVSDNPEHFSSIGSALAQIPANNTTPVIIEIAPGIYHEKLTINKPYITLRGMGESSAHTVISYDDYALDPASHHRKCLRGFRNTRTGDRSLCRRGPSYDRFLPPSRPSGHTFYRTASRKGTTAWRFHRSKTVCPAYQWQTIL